MPILNLGSEGKSVKIWQVILDLKVDGEFGVETMEATMAFQADHGLPPDGRVDSSTWSAGLGTL